MKSQLNIWHRTEQEWIADARKTAQRLLLRIERVSIEDVLRECPRPTWVSKKANAKVFNHEIFHPIGYTRAKADAANGHVIRLWGLNTEYYDPTKLRGRRRFEAADTR